MQANPEVTRLFTIDPEFGFRPILGNGLYNEYGTKTNTYPPTRRPEIKRILFMGDSVTSRGKIIDALRDVYGEQTFEYWNAGVESFNTVQEVNYYKKYNAALRPDHVILTFHLNDFETTPVAFRENGRLRVYAPNARLDSASQWLFQHSYCYRLLLGLLASRREGAIADEVRASLKDLKNHVIASGADLTVLVFPYMQPYEEWQSHEKESRNQILEILTGLEIRHFDLFDPFSESLKRGVAVQEKPGDTWHPSEAVSAEFAAYLRERRLLTVQ
jgi:hypothetical protein